MNGNSGDKKHCKRGHEFTPENTKINSKGARVCITCRRIKKREGYITYKHTAVYKASIKRRTDRLSHKRYMFIYNLKTLYNITFEIFTKLLIDQLGKCGICKKQAELVPDHCHLTGKFRGLLCQKCNTALGLFDDNIENINESIKYLKK